MMHASLAAAIVSQAASAAAPHHHGFWGAIGGWLQHVGLVVRKFFEPFGIWGLAGLSLLDAALIPLPGGMIGIVSVYVAKYHENFLLCAFVTAFASTVGSMVPYYIGRLGGEQFLLKKINRQRYERMRDRFERQEFLAILLPAMSPPPMPLKVFEFCAGVFEMRARNFAAALFLGKFVQFLIVTTLVYRYGSSAQTMLEEAVRHHARGLLLVVGLLFLGLAVWMVRKVFDRRRGVLLPIEEEAAAASDPSGIDAIPAVPTQTSAREIVEE